MLCKQINSLFNFLSTFNVIGYNFADGSSLASADNSSIAGAQAPDILLHGYYPAANLFEGNVMDILSFRFSSTQVRTRYIIVEQRRPGVL